MINLVQSASASPLVHTVSTDPGMSWVRDATVAIEAPPDDDVNPLPEAQWSAQAVRTGLCGAVAPRIIALPDGGYRMYYSQMLPRPGFPAGANDYDNATTRVVSATSPDGLTWTPEPGVRLTSQEGGAGDFRVVSSEVVPLADDTGRLRMYYECCNGPQSKQNSIRSALSEDGLMWTPEPGARFEMGGRNFMSPRIIFLDDGRWRLYCCERGKGIVSAISEDGGLTFHQESGFRIAQDGPYDQNDAFASEILRIDGAGYRMYYAGYSTPSRAYILSAVSDDGLTWKKETEPVLSPGHGVWDAAKCSEMCIICLPNDKGQRPRYRIFYEASDGTAQEQRGVWRIASAMA